MATKTQLSSICLFLAQLTEDPLIASLRSHLSLIGSDPGHLVGRTDVMCSVGRKDVFSINNICCSLRGLT